MNIMNRKITRQCLSFWEDVCDLAYDFVHDAEIIMGLKKMAVGALVIVSVFSFFIFVPNALDILMTIVVVIGATLLFAGASFALGNWLWETFWDN